MRISRIAVAGALALSLSVAGMTATAHADTSGLTASTFDLPSLSNEVTTTSDADSASVATPSSTTVDVPRNASNGVKLTSGGEQITIGLPETTGAQAGTVTAPGIVAYPTTSGDVANAVQTDEGGSARFLTVLKDADAPEEFQYNLDLPEGSSITKEANGGLTIHTPAGEYTVAPPWAHDANGEHVWTQYFTDGESTIDLVVNHHGENLAYPITADPYVSWGWSGATIYYSYSETGAIGAGSFALLSNRLGGAGASVAIAMGAYYWGRYGANHRQCLTVWKSYYSSPWWPGIQLWLRPC